MSAKDSEIEKIIESLDAGDSSQASKELSDDYAAIVKAVNYIGEEELKNSLNQIHSEMNTGMFFGKNLYWISGIAATLIGVFFWWQSMNPKLVSPELQMNEIPVYSDSSTYDSLKSINSKVDK